ncbi:MAG: thiamine-phosphate kinase [Candidatus Omnitrophota bacterium]
MKELQIIDHIRKRAGKPAGRVKLGIGDDCAVIQYSRDKYLLWAQDMLVDGTHFELGKEDLNLIGRKAVSVNISDIAAMGGVPEYITAAIGVPGSLRAKDIRKIYNGVFDVCNEYGIKVVGGDTNRSEKLVIDVSIIGFVEKSRLATRSGAKKGDVVFITGPVRDGKKEHLTFTPRLKESCFLTKRYKINAMIDVSDGIAMDIYRICSESRVGCVLEEDKIRLSKQLKLKDALYYGESFELLFTMSSVEADRLIKKSEDKKTNCFRIGNIVERKNGIKMIWKDGKIGKLEVRGYRHVRP